MRTIRTKIYKFNELSNDVKQTVIDRFRNNDSIDYQFIWDNTIEDAKEIGLEITTLDDHLKNDGNFMLSANEVAQNIFNNHGESCETYKTAESFMKDWQPIFDTYMETEEGEDKLIDIENDFLNSLLEDYRILYNNDIEFQSTDENIIETIQANEYEFTKDGRMI